MNEPQCISLMDALAAVPDPRKARGKRHSWVVLLTLVSTGLASGQQTAHAIAQWVQFHAAPLRAAIPRLIRLPSESTLLRTVRLIDVAVREAAIAQVIAPAPTTVAAPSIVTPAGTLLDAYAVDGNALRGATA
jgi:hypothetical protein